MCPVCFTNCALVLCFQYNKSISTFSISASELTMDGWMDIFTKTSFLNYIFIKGHVQQYLYILQKVSENECIGFKGRLETTKRVKTNLLTFKRG